jgi:DNA repair protein RadC
MENRQMATSINFPAVSEIPAAERPASRLRHLGPSVLTSAELMALVIGGPEALGLGTAIMAQAEGSLRKLSMLPVAQLERTKGIGEMTANRVAAALELGRRLAAESRDHGVPVRSPRDVARYYAPRMEDLAVEEFHVAILDAQHRLERDVTVTRGILTSSLVHPREVFREAIAERAAALILVHNHPSGDPTPSADDRLVTEQLVAAGKLLDLPVHDHVIIGRGRYTSFAEAGLL